MTEQNSQSAPPDGGYGWVIIISIVLINASLLTLVNSFGIIFHDEFEEMGITSAETAFLLHLQSSLNCFIAFASSPILKKLGYRSVAFLGSILMCSGIFLTSFATSYAFLIFSVSILTGLGQGIVMPATYLASYTYFKKRLTIAISLSVTGASLSNVVMPKLCDRLISTIGRKYTILTLAAVSLLSLIGCALLKPLKENDDFDLGTKHDEEPLKIKEETRTNNNVYEQTTVPKIRESTCSKLKSRIYEMFDLQLLKDVKFMMIIIGLGISFAAELNIIFMIQFILREFCYFNRSEVATAVSIQFVADIVGRLLVPFVAHLVDIDSRVMYGGALLFATLARSIINIWNNSHYVIYFACALIGLTKGTRAVFQSVIIPKFVPLEKLPTANGLNMLLSGILSLKIGTILGYIHDATNSYSASLITGSILSCSCVVLWIFGLIIRKKEEKRQLVDSVQME